MATLDTTLFHSGSSDIKGCAENKYCLWYQQHSVNNCSFPRQQIILQHKIYFNTKYTLTQNIRHHRTYFNTKYTLTQNILHHKIYSNTKYTLIQNILQPSGEEFLSSLKINTRNRFLVVTFFLNLSSFGCVFCHFKFIKAKVQFNYNKS